VALAHTTAASTKAFRHTQIQEALHISGTMVMVQHQLGETPQAMEQVAIMVMVQHQLGETPQAMEQVAIMVMVQHQLGEVHLTQSVLATASAAN
jgi:hypothetical protein